MVTLFSRGGGLADIAGYLGILAAYAVARAEAVTPTDRAKTGR